jgi:hypothetical protein
MRAEGRGAPFLTYKCASFVLGAILLTLIMKSRGERGFAAPHPSPLSSDLPQTLTPVGIEIVVLVELSQPPTFQFGWFAFKSSGRQTAGTLVGNHQDRQERPALFL